MDGVSLFITGLIQLDKSYNNAVYSSNGHKIHISSSDGLVGSLGLPLSKFYSSRQLEWLKMMNTIHLDVGSAQLFLYGNKGLKNTLHLLNKATISHAGSGINQFQAFTEHYKIIKGVTYGFSTVSTNINHKSMAYLNPLFDHDVHSYIDLVNIMCGKCDHMIVHIHYTSDDQCIPLWFTDFSKKLIMSGIKIIIGVANNVVWPIIPYQQGIICPSLGILKDDGQGMIVDVMFDKTKLLSWNRLYIETNKEITKRDKIDYLRYE
jgi:hypothetical protein